MYVHVYTYMYIYIYRERERERERERDYILGNPRRPGPPGDGQERLP